MGMFVWNMAISFQLLFIIISSVIYLYLRDKSFKFYALYNIFLLIYLLSRNDDYYYAFEGALANFIGIKNSEILTHILCFLDQVIFYNSYSVFALYFLDLNRLTKKHFKNVILILRILGVLFIFFAVITYILKNSDLYITLYTFIYLPAMLTVFIITVMKASKLSGKHKSFFLVGVSIFVCCALIAFAGSFIPSLNMNDPIKFFYIGIIIETIFFSLGLAYKVKLLNDEKNRVHNVVLQHRYKQQLSKLQGLLEGEEKERKRMAEELHDGIAGDLSAIKYNLNFLNRDNGKLNDNAVMTDVLNTIERSCQQIREISHNLSPSSITNFGLIGAIELFCKKVEKRYGTTIDFTYSNEVIELHKTIETHIYRIIQELVNNVIKHSEASAAEVDISFNSPLIIVSVQDNGKGFSLKAPSKGIGLSNIESRIRFMNAKINKEVNGTGSLFIITINLNQIPETS